MLVRVNLHAGINVNHECLYLFSDFLLDDVRCSGSESNLAQCSHSSWGSHDCSSAEHVFIRSLPGTSFYSLKLVCRVLLVICHKGVPSAPVLQFNRYDNNTSLEISCHLVSYVSITCNNSPQELLEGTFSITLTLSILFCRLRAATRCPRCKQAKNYCDGNNN